VTFALAPLEIRLYRMLSIAFQRAPLSGEGASRYGGRWNARGMPALYLARDPVTAVAEFYQGLPRPGTLAPYQLAANAIADLTNGGNEAVAWACAAPWKALVARGETPPGWTLADDLIAAGAEGALVPSTQNRGGACLVLWRWHDAREGAGEGAALTLLDPEGALEA
jgi:RES domain-containing protein